MNQANVVIIGCGGIGGWLVEPVARYLNYSQYNSVELLLVDGDSYEPKNLNRQIADVMENKAQVAARRVKHFDRLSVRAKAEYLTADNIGQIIKENHVVMLCVDNDPARKLVSDYAETMMDVLVICGANDEYDGSIQVYQRKNRQDVTYPLTHRTEIRFPRDHHPANLNSRTVGCDVNQDTTPQLICANFMAAAMMLNTLCTISDNYDKWPRYDDGFFDTRTNNAKSQRRIRHDRESTTRS